MRHKKLTCLYVEERGKLKCHGACRSKLSHLGIKLRGLLGIVRVWSLKKNVDGLPQFGHRSYGISLFIVDMGQEFEERDATGSGYQILSQQGFGQP